MRGRLLAAESVPDPLRQSSLIGLVILIIVPIIKAAAILLLDANCSCVTHLQPKTPTELGAINVVFFYTYEVTIVSFCASYCSWGTASF